MAKPEIRLKGFEGEWVLSSFSKLGTLRRGLTYTPSNIDFSGVRVLRSSNINEDTFVLSSDDVFVREDCVNIDLVNDGDILITAANGSPRLVGKHCVIKKNKDEKMAHGGFMLLASSAEPYFLNYSMSSSWYRDFQRIGIAGGNGAIGNLNKNELENFPFYIPKDNNERKGVADYFKSLDSMIQGVTKKIASLKQMKQACLVSMFPQAGETTPRVRFKGFDEEWGSTPLSKFSKKVTRKNNNLEFKITLTNSAEYGVINQLDFFDHDISNGDNIRGYYVVENDDFVYNPRVSASAPVGPINRNMLGYSGVMSPLYYVFKVKGIDKDYLSYFFKTNLWHKFMKDNGNSGARFDRLSITDDIFVQMPILYPKDNKEQQKIASYFTSLDKQISLQEARLEKLKHIKSACLDKMFV